MADHVVVRGLRVEGIHGVLPQEQQTPQPFRVDLDLEVDLSVPAATDDLVDTVDYGLVAEAVAAVVRHESFQLLEALAGRIASLVLDDDRVSSVDITVTKLEPPLDLDLEGVAVRLVRSRG